MKRIRALLAWLSEPSRRFVPLFLVYLALGSVVMDRLPPRSLDALLRGTAWVDYQLLRLFSDQVRLDGVIVSLDGFAVRIITECTGLYESLILIAAVLAYRASWRERLLGAVAGTGLLYLMNVLRIAFLLVVGRHAPDLFDFAHVYFWQTLLAVFIVLLWIVWIRYVVQEVAQDVVQGAAGDVGRDEADPALRA